MLACGSTNKPGTGIGGSASGGTSGAGGASAKPTDAAIPGGAGGTQQGTGGATIGGGGGNTSSGVGGGAGGIKPGSGGTTSGSGGMTSKGGTSGNGGKTGIGGTTGSGIDGGSKGGADGGSGGTTGDSGGLSGAVPSAGCGLKNNPASGRFTIDVSGTPREYILKVPDGYDANHPYRLIFGWHGAKYDAEWVANGESPLTGPYFGIESEAKGSAVFVAPQAASGGWSTKDLAFADAMVSQFEAQLCIDKSRIFSVGFSMGAIMTITIGCSRSDVFRGIAPMSGSLQNSCPTGNHVAYWASHGTEDPTIPIAEGEKARDEFAKRNHCGAKTEATARSGCVTYQGCDLGYPVTWCTFSGVHEPAPFAGPAIWEFISPL